MLSIRSVFYKCLPACFGVLVLLSSCGKSTEPTSGASSAVQPTSSAHAASSAQNSAEPVKPASGGSYSDEENEIAPEIKSLVLDYMNLYYDSLACLALCPQDELTALFSKAAPEQALGNYTVWEYLIETRKMQRTDLSMVAYRYTMHTRETEELEDGSLRLMVIENSVQNFAAHPQVDSECIRVYHSFTFVKEDGLWRIRDHMQLDSLYFTLFGTTDERNLMDSFKNPSFPSEDTERFLSERLQELLTKARTALAERLHTNPLPPVTVAHPYDRRTAVAYAEKYADARNEEWPDYGIYGGNCQNYVSQCLLAGGIPMDTEEPAVWKWYSGVPHDLAGAVGRSSSWSSVPAFRTYVQTNTGYGLAGQVDAPYYSGESGDMLLMGPVGNWKHTVIITEPVQDENGATVDYLINSNTADLRDYPAGAYSYTNQSLVKIWGWNES